MTPNATVLQVARTLAFAEQDFLHTGQGLLDLADILVECGPVVPECYTAGRKVKRLQKQLEKVLIDLDESISDLIKLAQDKDDEPPF